MIETVQLYHRNGTTSVSHGTDKGLIYYLLNGGFTVTDE